MKENLDDKRYFKITTRKFQSNLLSLHSFIAFYEKLSTKLYFSRLRIFL
jgi:hypothetical protein